MSVNLDKNRDQLVAAWKSVLDDKRPTDWALFGYEPQSNDLRVVATGDGGLAELNEDLNTSNIMYAFVRVLDPKTSLTKYVLINWQGDGTPTVRKGTCANHIRDVARLFAGAHCTINARNEDEMEPDLIMKQVSSVGSAYSFKEPRMQHEEQRGPVGTNYARTIPGREINARDRDQFWRKEEAEEKRRLELDRERVLADRERADRERKQREEKEQREREMRVAAAELEVEELGSPVRGTQGGGGGGSATVVPKTSPQPLSPVQLSPVRSATVADEMRQQRNNEAKALIGTRVGAAKAIFTQHSASGQLHHGRAPAPAKPARNSIAQRINTFNNAAATMTTSTSKTEEAPSHDVDVDVSPVTENILTDVQAPKEQAHGQDNQHDALNLAESVSATEKTENQRQNGHTSENTQPAAVAERTVTAAEIATSAAPVAAVAYEEDAVGDQYSTIKRSPYTKQNSTASNNSQVATPVEPDAPATIPEVVAAAADVVVVAKSMPSAAQHFASSAARDASRGVVIKNDIVAEDDIIYQDIMKDVGLRARALYDYQAADESEITFDPGDVITHIDQIDEGWWQGLGPDGAYGLFPANYVQLI